MLPEQNFYGRLWRRDGQFPLQCVRLENGRSVTDQIIGRSVILAGRPQNYPKIEVRPMTYFARVIVEFRITLIKLLELVR